MHHDPRKRNLMKNVLKVGLAVGILTSIWQLIMVGTGWLVRPQTFPDVPPEFHLRET